jgi:DNA-binding MarR family transcriptional regulator
MPYPKREKLVPRVERPRQEYQLSATQALVYAWLAERGTTATSIEMAAGTNQPRGTVTSAINRLELYGLIRDTTPKQRVGKLYEAMPMPDSSGA